MESKKEVLKSLLDNAEERAERKLGKKYAKPTRLLEKKLITGKESAFSEFWDSLYDLDEDDLRQFVAFLGGRLEHFYRESFDFSDEAFERAGRIRKAREEG